MVFGRGPGGGKDSHSRQWRLSMAVFLNRNKRPSAAPIEVAEASLREAASLAYLTSVPYAAVITTKQQETAPNSQGRTVCRSHQLEPQLLFGRGGLGERRFS